MPKYKVHLNFTYEDDEWVEIEADNESEAQDRAEDAAYGPNDAYDHAVHTSTMMLEWEEIEDSEDLYV